MKLGSLRQTHLPYPCIGLPPGAARARMSRVARAPAARAPGSGSYDQPPTSYSVQCGSDYPPNQRQPTGIEYWTSPAGLPAPRAAHQARERAREEQRPPLPRPPGPLAARNEESEFLWAGYSGAARRASCPLEPLALAAVAGCLLPTPCT